MTEALVGFGTENSETDDISPEFDAIDVPEVVEDTPQTEAPAEDEAPAELVDEKPKEDLFVFTPTIDSDERVFPPSLVAQFESESAFRDWLKKPVKVIRAKHLIPKGCERWFFDQLRDKEGLDQPRFWLQEAHASDLLRQRIMLLTDDDFTRFFVDWQKDSFGADAGE